MMATLDALGVPLVTTVVDGSRADDPLYVPAVTAVRASLGQRGLLYVGDSKTAALARRATIVIEGDYYLCPLSQVQLSAEALQGYLEPVWRNEQVLNPLERTPVEGKPVHLANGFELSRHLEAEVNGQQVAWRERRLVVCSLKQAQQLKRGLDHRLAKAQQAITALNVPKQGRQRPQTQTQWHQQVTVILKQYRLEGLLEVSYDITTQQRQIRRYRDRPQRTETWQQIKATTTTNEPAIETLARSFGWRVYVTNAPEPGLSLAKAVLAYRGECCISQGCVG